jgi:hypothetical protein
MQHRMLPIALVAVFALPACDLGEGSLAEMRMAVDESVATGEAASLEEGVIEITTDFTIGQGLQDVAGHIRGLVESQIPCSTVESPDANTLVIDFGATGDMCEYNGRTYGGKVTLAYEVTGDTINVQHAYDGLTNGRVTIDGEASVTWRPTGTNGLSRHIVSSIDLSGPRGDFHSDADRTQTFANPGSGVFEVEGSREWSGPRGDGSATWEATIDIDFAVPIAGSAEVHTPRGSTFDLSFDLIDGDTVEIRVTGGRKDRVFHVTTSGQVDDEGEG